ncbi:MAG: outer membrane lipoprotein-sorting protein [Fimbriimonas sp.]
MNALLALTAILSVQSNSFDDYVQKNFRDASFTARKKMGDQRELKKVNDDFGQSYRFDYTNVKVKEPFKFRLESNVEDTSVVYILNGTDLSIRVPKLRVNSKQNLAKSPGRRQTLLDFGILTPSLTDLFETKFVRIDRATGNAVFDLTYPKALDDTSRNRIWVDAAKKIVTKREWYNQEGLQIATFFYESPVQVSGVWVPTVLTVRNTDNKVAGVMHYENFKLNTGLDDSLFVAK